MEAPRFLHRPSLLVLAGRGEETQAFLSFQRLGVLSGFCERAEVSLDSLTLKADSTLSPLFSSFGLGETGSILLGRAVALKMLTSLQGVAGATGWGSKGKKGGRAARLNLESGGGSFLWVMLIEQL